MVQMSDVSRGKVTLVERQLFRRSKIEWQHDDYSLLADIGRGGERETLVA